jgi:hypothetical protein
MLIEFSDLFPKELPELPPKRELELKFEIKLRIEHIAKAPYHMMTPKL